MLAARFHAVLLSLAVLTLAGCASHVAGRGAANPVDLRRVLDDRTPLTGKAALGDYATVDYCGMVDPAAATKAGATDPGTPLRSFDYCLLPVKSGGKEIEVQIGYLETRGSARDVRLPDPSKKFARGLTAERSPGRDESCSSYLTFSDGVAVEVQTQGYTRDGSSSGVDSSMLCTISSAMVDGVADAVLGNKIGHLNFGPDSLGKVNACDVVGEELIIAELGFAVPTSKALSTHRCRWASLSSSGPSVSLSFSVDKSPSVSGGASAETIGGRSSVVRAYTSEYCSVEVGLGHAEAAPDGEVQQALLFVSRTSKDPCEVARNVANAVWPKLPSA